MKARTEFFDAVAKSEDLAVLRRQRAGVAKDPINAELVEAIDARVAELSSWNADPMSEEFRTLLEENEKALGKPLSRTRAMVKRRTDAGMSTLAAVIDTVTTLVAPEHATPGFKKLADIGRLDLTFEVFVLNYASEFPRAVVRAARIRLKGAGYHPA
jgi:hypothetical protein